MIRPRSLMREIARRKSPSVTGSTTSAVFTLSIRNATSSHKGDSTLADYALDLSKLGRRPPLFATVQRIIADASFGAKSDLKLKKNTSDNEPTPEEPAAPEKKDEKDKKEDKNIKEDKDKKITPDEDVDTPTVSIVAEVSASGSVPSASLGNGGDNNNNNKKGNDSFPTLALNALGEYPPLLAIAMKDRPPLPGNPFSINISDPNVKKAIAEICDRREPHFVLFHMKDPDEPDTDSIQNRSSVYDMGVHCYVLRHYEDGPYLHILGYSMERCEIKELCVPGDEVKSTSEDGVESTPEDEDFPTSYLKDFNVSYARVKACEDEPYDIASPEFRALLDEAKVLFAKMVQMVPNKKDAALSASKLLSDPHKLADFIGSSVSAMPHQVQKLLEELNIEARLLKAVELLRLELNAMVIADKSMREMSARADDAQVKLVITEYIKGLKKNVGLNEPENNKIQKFEERLKHLTLTDEAMEAYKAEVAKMSSLGEHSSELAVSERYLDWLTSIPWGVYSKDRFNIKIARETLDRDHYGLKDVKDRILEFISQGKVSGKVDGKILCLAGPPGTGKTSIAKSIAEALDRRYVRIAMGGIQDVHEVKGHRRTYIGSIPGRIISALKQAKTSNPLMLIDEIDKLDLSRSGGAASAFLEILDPEQNNAFVDNYIDLNVDLSKVLFVCTANYLGNIPPPLRDRMEIIDVSGYTNNEKIEIVKNHLIPQAAKKAGLDETHLVIPTETIAKLVEKYCRESGLRNVKKLITRIFSKASLKIVEEIENKEAKELEAKELESKAVEPIVSAAEPKEESAVESVAVEEDVDVEVKPLDIPADIKLEITPEVLKDYIGAEIYTRARLYDIPPPGVATGLAYTTSGNGDALYIESILTQSIGSGTGHAGMHVTGHLKDVMKESASIAYSYAKLFMVRKFPENRFFQAADIHVHCPDGAVPKDGPSAGISFTSSLISLAINESLPAKVAMTGEITLTGRVLPVGGLREKTLGAKRYGCDTIIFPKDIENELEEIPEEVKAGITFIPVEWYSEVFDNLFPNADKEKFNTVWKEEFAKLDEKKKGKK